MMKKILHGIFLVGAILAASSTQAATPGQPQLMMTFSLTGERGEVEGVLTAPLNDMYQKDLPQDLKMDITVYRSAYSLGQSNLVVGKFGGMSPGQSVEFTDNVIPAWEINQDYTYTAEAIAPGYTFFTGYGSLNPGLDFTFPQNALTLTPGIDGHSVELAVKSPEKMTSGVDLEEPMTAMEFYRATDVSSWPYKYMLIHSVADPQPGETLTYTDNDPMPDKENYYRVRAVTKYGYADVQEHCYVGLDVPAAPYPVEATAVAAGVKVTWTAPDRGESWGAIDPADIWYNVYRCYGYGNSNREQIAVMIRETSFVDTAEGLSEPIQVRYEVEAGNSKGTGGSNYSSPDYDLTVGPAYGLPFIDTFDGGLNKVWTLTESTYKAAWYEATEAEYGTKPVRVKPVKGSGLVYVDYVYNSPASGTTNTMTSYKIDMREAENPWVSFWYYAIPDNDVTIEVASSADPANFGEGKVMMIADGVTSPAWKQVYLPMSGMAGEAAAYLRFTTSFTDMPSSAILDDVVVMDYPTVGNLDGKVNEDDLTVTLTWSLDHEGMAECLGYVGYVDGEEFGEVTSPWVYGPMEMDRVYTFQIRPLYEGVEAEVSAPLGVILNAPAETEFTVGDYDYSLITTDEDAVDQSVCITGYHGRGGLLRLPGNVTYKETEYAVCGVGEDAFAGNAVVESVSIPEGYGFLLRGAFRDAINLEAVIIPASMLTIAEEAFAGCGSLSMVTFVGAVPPTVGEDAFNGIAEGCVGKCPEGSEDAYEGVENLSTISFERAGISGISNALSDVEYYTLTGIKLSTAPTGSPYIKRVQCSDGRVVTTKHAATPLRQK